MIAPYQGYHEADTDPSAVLPEVRELLSRIPNPSETCPEELSWQLGTQPWVVEAALEALLIEGEVMP